MLVTEKFLRSLVSKYGKQTVYTDGGTWYDDDEYDDDDDDDEACNVIGLNRSPHSPFHKSFMERVNQYLKDRTEGFDDYYPCIKEECTLFHVYNWIQFFVSMYNDTIAINNNYDFGLKQVNIILN